MFESALIDPIAYRDPWDMPFERRMSMLCARKTRIAYFYDLPDTSTFRYRAFNMVEAVNDDAPGGVSASWFHLGDFSQMHSVIAAADVLVFCRGKYSPTHARVVHAARQRGIPVGFDIDDLVFDPQYAHMVLDTLDQDTNNDGALTEFFGFMARHGVLLKLCDFAVTTNRFLADRISDFAPDLRVGIVPNFLNRRQQELSEELFLRKSATGFETSRPYSIGYFSGTPTHRRDFAVASQALAQLLERHQDLRLTVVGFLESGPYLERHLDRIDRYPLQDFLNLQRLIACTDINIAPLIDNTFTNCKSELKYFEAAITGTLTVATPTFTFKDAVNHARSGYLARSFEWRDVLEAALCVLNDRDRYAEIAHTAFEQCSSAYGWNRQSKRIRSVILGS
ncbi:glycosyltransferase [Caballeronia sp. GAWG1-1]|uniref:glycosyltransferase n=1 Tax=Caballeronia sp. GAWG1-1 TaxID=2921742 RepID=UPI002027C4D3|nr:glycosyltransferase [Caballeronia sp. GAWG1-1]